MYVFGYLCKFYFNFSTILLERIIKIEVNLSYIFLHLLLHFLYFFSSSSCCYFNLALANKNRKLNFTGIKKQKLKGERKK